jgi:hypothetical protein
VPLDPHCKLTEEDHPRNRESEFSPLARGFFQTMLQNWHEERPVLKGLVRNKRRRRLRLEERSETNPILKDF